MGPIYQTRVVFRQPHGTNPAVLLAGAPRVFHLLLQVGSDPYSPDFSKDFGVSGSPNAAAVTTSVGSGSHLNQSAAAASPSTASVQKRTCF
jgi:hypothetical protein